MADRHKSEWSCGHIAEAMCSECYRELAQRATAAFLDGMADRLEGHGNANRHTAAADCRAMAAKLRGKEQRK